MDGADGRHPDNILQQLKEKRKELDTEIASLDTDIRVFRHTLSQALEKQSIKHLLEKIHAEHT